MARMTALICLVMLALCQLPSCGSDSSPGETCETMSCSQHGSCDDSTGVIVCTCETGYSGAACETCADGYQDPGDGSCVLADPCANDTACAQLHRECQNVQGQAECGDCLAGYHEEGDLCAEDLECLENSCASHGSCDDSSGQVVCTCDPGYQGDHCEACADGYAEWPADSGECLDDPCDPDPCDLDHAVPGGCVQTGPADFICACENNYSWDGEACQPACIDGDQDGYGEGNACLDIDCDDGDAAINPGHEEICDGKDNDCDEDTDEEVSPPDCPLPDTGVCQGATSARTCEGVDGWSECDYGSDYHASETDCDDLDNDCDSETDEDYPDRGLPCDSGDSDDCENGTWTCTAAGDGVECVNESAVDIAEVCNGVDDDCDGATDEDVTEPMEACENTVPGVGTCTGSWQCQAEEGWQCDALVPAPEACDGLDNDCDPATPDGSADPLDGTPCDGEDTDVCLEGTFSCQASELVCSDSTSSTPELCNGVDDDCDGSSDEDFNQDNNPACADGTIVMGAVSGDTLSDVLSESYYDERWLTAYINEDNPVLDPLTATISLWSPPGTDFDLHVWCDNCTGAFVGSSTNRGLTGHWDEIEVRAEDDFGFDDDYWVYIQVEYFQASECAYWDLTVEGNTEVATTTCF